MSSERRLLLAMVLCVAAVVGIEVLFPAPPPADPVVETPTADPEADPVADPAAGATAPPPVATDDGAPSPAAAADDDGRAVVPPAGPVPVTEPEAVPDQALPSGRLRTSVRARGATLGALHLAGIVSLPGGDPANEADWLPLLLAPDEHLDENGDPVVGSVGLTLRSNDMGIRDLESCNWSLLSEPGAFPQVWEAHALKAEEGGRGLIVRKIFTPADGADDFHLRVAVEIENTDPDLVGRTFRVHLRGPALLQPPDPSSRDILHGVVKKRGDASLESTMGPSVVSGLEDSEPIIVADEKPASADDDIEWAGAATTYFAAVLRPRVAVDADGGSFVQDVWWDALTPVGYPDPERRGPQASPILRFPERVPDPGVVRRWEFEFFGVPKAGDVVAGNGSVAVLDREDYADLRPVQDKGMLALLVDGLFLILKGFHALTGSWGIAIILLTVFIRGCMTPLSRRQMRSTVEYGEKMKKIQPKIAELKARYGKNREKMQREQMRLMKENDVPLMPGGCLLTFLQMPIWFALYGMLQSNYDLRHASFMWIDDLAQADHLFHLLPNVRTIPLVPNAVEWLNLLPLVMAATMYFSAKATQTTAAADPQQEQMQKMMMTMMPAMMLLFLYTMPAGLCLYITISSFWGIIESRVVKKKLADEKAAREAADAQAAA